MFHKRLYKLKLGFHVSISGGIDKSVDRARELECDTFQIFTRNPRSWSSRDLNEKEVILFREKLRKTRIAPVFAHMPYILNLSSPENMNYKCSISSLEEEIRRCNMLGISYIVTHLGSHLGTGAEKGIKQVVNALKKVIAKDSTDINILLENSAGSERQIGSDFKDLKSIIEDVNDPRIGACFDTCHAYAAGMNIESKKGLQKTLQNLEEAIGFERLKLVHLNDSVGELGSHYDKHEHIGFGKIGKEGFKRLLHSGLKNYPLIMETPMDERRSDKQNLEYVRRLGK